MIDTFGFSWDKKSSYFELKQFHRLKAGKKGHPEGMPLILDTPGGESPVPESLEFYTSARALRGQFEEALSRAKGAVKRRQIATFGSTGPLDAEIETLFGQCYTLLRKFEDSSKPSPLIKGSFGIESLRAAMSAHLQNELRTMAAALKAEETGFARKLRGQESQGKSTFDFINALHDEGQATSFIAEDGSRVVLKELNTSNAKEIERIVDNITKLSNMLSSLNDMALEQGSVVDRIDVSLKETLDRTQRGNAELFRAKEEMERGCAAKLLKLLLFANAVLFVLLLLKFR